MTNLDAQAAAELGRDRQASVVQLRSSPDTLTELGNARRLVREHGEQIRHDHTAGRWLAWDGTRWADDGTGEVVRRAKLVAQAMLDEAARQRNDRDRQELAKHALKSMTARGLRNMVALAATETGIPVHPSDLDADPMVLNAANGLINLRTGQLGPHDASKLCSRLAPVWFDPDAQAPTFARFLERITGGDADLERYLQRLAGYSLTGLTDEQILPVLHGAGANGKSTLVELLRELLGDYATSMPPDLLVQRRGGDQQPHGLVRLRGARLVSASETDDGARLSVALVKQLTGGDTITARRLYGEFFDFRPVAKIWLSTNHRPRITDTTESIWRRVRLIPFGITIPPDQRDPQLPTKLRRELPGVLNWAIAGCLAWQQHGLGTASAVTDATDDYRAESDPLGLFIAERCIEGEHHWVAASDLWAAWSQWASSRGEQDGSARTLGVRLGERGYQQRRTTSARCWVGLGLLAMTDDAS